jgi:cyclopropane fatty-acyl-phospholipid synthase-like methyltransferase
MFTQKSMNYEHRFYSSQEKLRGITSTEHVKFWGEVQGKLYDVILDSYLENHKHSRIIEIASGPGIFLRYLKEKGFSNFTGIEMAENYVKLCLEQNLDVVSCDAFDWLKSQPPSSVNIVVAIDFIEHLDKQGFLDFLDLVRHVLTPDGLFIARGPCGDSPFFGLNYYNDITHQTVFTSVALTALMTICGFNTIQIQDEYPNSITGKQKIWKIPFSQLNRFLMRKFILWSTGQYICNLSPNIWIFARPSS